LLGRDSKIRHTGAIKTNGRLPRRREKDYIILITNKIEHDKVYEFSLDGLLSFGNLSEGIVREIFADGRVASHFLERQLPVWFPELEFVSGCKDHDHTRVDDISVKFDQKCFTKGGCRFMPSSMIGAGRKFNETKFLEKAKALTYIVCDITSLPFVQVIFKDGANLASEYPKGVITPNEKERLFDV